MSKQIITLYDHFKNTEEELKIICDWDEVIQPCEPYALWEATHKKHLKIELILDFEKQQKHSPNIF